MLEDYLDLIGKSVELLMYLFEVALEKIKYFKDSRNDSLVFDNQRNLDLNVL